MICILIEIELHHLYLSLCSLHLVSTFQPSHTLHSQIDRLFFSNDFCYIHYMYMYAQAKFLREDA